MDPHSTMHSNARSDCEHDFDISSIAPPAASEDLEEISSASLNLSDSIKAVHVAAVAKPPDALATADARSFNADDAIVAQPSEVLAIGVAGPSNTRNIAVNRPPNALPDVAGSSNVINNLSDFSSDALELSANTQEVMDLVYGDICAEEANQPKV